MPEFASRDPNTPAFWDERFERGFTPWDRGGVPQALRDFVARSGRPLVDADPWLRRRLRAGVPVGAGLGRHRDRFLAGRRGEGEGRAGAVGGRRGAGRFLRLPCRTRRSTLIYERAFLCALPRAMWPRVAARWADLLPPGGRLAGFFFFDDVAKGPPFGIDRAAARSVAQPAFRLHRGRRGERFDRRLRRQGTLDGLAAPLGVRPRLFSRGV